MVMASLRGNKGVNPYILIRLSNFFFEDPTYTQGYNTKGIEQSKSAKLLCKATDGIIKNSAIIAQICDPIWLTY